MDRRVKASLISIGADLVLITVKTILASLTGSAALLADAYHSLSDLFISGAVLTGSLFRSRMEKKAAEPAQEQPADLSRRRPGAWIDTIIAGIVAIIVLYLPVEIVQGLRSRSPIDPRFLWLAVVGIVLCIGIAYFLSRFKLIAGRETDSAALVADGYHSRTDMLTSLAVLGSLLGSMVGIDIDGIVAAVIAGFIALTGLDLLASAVIGGIVERDGYRFSLWSGGIEWSMKKMGGVVARLSGGRFDPRTFPWRRWGASALKLSKKVALFLTVALPVVYLLSGIHFVAPDETGVRVRFGRVIDAAIPPGVVWLLPPPFERLDRARPREVRRVEVGFRTAADLLTGAFPLIWDTTHTIRGYVKKSEEALTLTGDENLVDISLVLQYRPVDTLTAGYRVRAMDEVMRGLLESAMRTVMATEDSEELLGVDRLRSLEKVRVSVERDAAAIGLGVEIVSIFYHDLHPPLDVVPAFRAVFSAREEKIRAVNDAQSHANKEIPKARAAAVTETVGAEAQATERVDRASGDAARFSQVAVAFGRRTDVASYRLYIETMEEGLAGKEKIVADPAVAPDDYRLWHFAPDKVKQGR